MGLPCPSRSLEGETNFGVLSVFRRLKIRGKWSQHHAVVGCPRGMEAMCIGNFMRSGSAQSGGRVVHLVVVDMPRWWCASRVSEVPLPPLHSGEAGGTSLDCSGHHPTTAPPPARLHPQTSAHQGSPWLVQRTSSSPGWAVGTCTEHPTNPPPRIDERRRCISRSRHSPNSPFSSLPTVCQDDLSLAAIQRETGPCILIPSPCQQQWSHRHQHHHQHTPPPPPPQQHRWRSRTTSIPATAP